jgi:hypothetical protein
MTRKPIRSLRRLSSLAVVLLLASVTSASGEGVPRTASAEGAAAYIISPKEGDTVKSPVTVRFGLSGMGVAPAGMQKAGTGHHHLLVDTKLPDLGMPIPADDKHRHFGGGQTEVTIELPPGEHTLQLLLADERHVPHDPPVVSERITIEVSK